VCGKNPEKVEVLGGAAQGSIFEILIKLREFSTLLNAREFLEFLCMYMSNKIKIPSIKARVSYMFRIRKKRKKKLRARVTTALVKKKLCISKFLNISTALTSNGQRQATS
jgi:hypothetical protein